MAAFVVGIVVCFRKDRVVVVLRVRRVDGDERNVTPVLTALHRSGAGAFCLRQRIAGELVGNSMRVNGNEAHRALGFERTELLAHPRLQQAIRALF